jgi:hypothetical protein
MSTVHGTPWEHLPDPVVGVNTTPVYLQLAGPDDRVRTVAQALRHVQALPQPIAGRIASAPSLSVLLELSASPQIVAGYTAHRLGQDEQELAEILRVLSAHGLQVTLSV